jgi:hypothetical protein
MASVDDPILRETMQMYFDCDEIYVVRYDFAFIDPASRWFWQYGVDAQLLDLDRRDELLVPVAKATIRRILNRKCGVKLAVENQVHLDLPRGVSARYV